VDAPLSGIANADSPLQPPTGNLAADGVTSYTWNGAGLLKTAGSTTYTYDGDGKRVMNSEGTYFWTSPSGDQLSDTPGAAVGAGGDKLQDADLKGLRQPAYRGLDLSGE
jgi:hypothetical protein